MTEDDICEWRTNLNRAKSWDERKNLVLGLAERNPTGWMFEVGGVPLFSEPTGDYPNTIFWYEEREYAEVLDHRHLEAAELVPVPFTEVFEFWRNGGQPSVIVRDANDKPVALFISASMVL